MTSPRIHAPHLDEAMARDLWARCGRYAVDAEHVAVEAAAVTCRDCLRELDGAEIEPPFTPHVIERLRWGARELDEHGRRALAASYRREESRPRPWASSAEQAVRRYVSVHDEGAALRSTCDPARANRVQTSSDPSLGGREHDAVERVATVARALEAVVRMPMAVSEACPTVTPRQALDVYLRSVVGRESTWYTRPDGKGAMGRRISESPTEMVINLQRDCGVRLCHYDEADCGEVGGDSCTAIAVHYVYRLRRLFAYVVGEALKASGELREREAPRAAVRRGRWDPLARLREAQG